jgi:hypothetical protein
MRTVDRVLAYVCALAAVFALAFAVGRIVGPFGDGPSPLTGHDSGNDSGHHSGQDLGLFGGSDGGY